MNRLRAVLGFVAGAMLILSSAAHSILGWKALGAQLATTNAPADLVRGLQIGWLFGGVAMFCFGVIVVTLFRRRLRGAGDALTPAAIVGVAYVAFGAWALIQADDPFFLFVFILPGALLVAAAAPWGSNR